MGITDMLEVKKNELFVRDSKRIQFLLEQSLIAKELNLSDNQQSKHQSLSFNTDKVEGIPLGTSKEKGQYNVSLNVNTNDVSYYLRGYKAIDKEINIIKNREHIQLSNTTNKVETLKESNINWINYNIFLLDSVPIKQTFKKTTIPLHLGIVFGLIIGVFYVFISNALRPLEISKK